MEGVWSGGVRCVRFLVGTLVGSGEKCVGWMYDVGG